MEYYKVIKGNEILLDAMMWTSLESIMLSERSQRQKATSCMMQIHEMSIAGNSVEIESKLVVARGGGQGDSGE